MSDDVTCARCGDYAKEHPEDTEWACPECGVEPIPEPPVPATRTEGHRPATVVVALIMLAATTLIAPPALGLLCRAVCRLFLLGWELIP